MPRVQQVRATACPEAATAPPHQAVATPFPPGWRSAWRSPAKNGLNGTAETPSANAAPGNGPRRASSICPCPPNTRLARDSSPSQTDTDGIQCGPPYAEGHGARPLSPARLAGKAVPHPFPDVLSPKRGKAGHGPAFLRSGVDRPPDNLMSEPRQRRDAQRRLTRRRPWKLAAIRRGTARTTDQNSSDPDPAPPHCR